MSQIQEEVKSLAPVEEVCPPATETVTHSEETPQTNPQPDVETTDNVATPTLIEAVENTDNKVAEKAIDEEAKVEDESKTAEACQPDVTEIAV